jgi:hypothetical protein
MAEACVCTTKDFLIALHDALWELSWNGWKAVVSRDDSGFFPGLHRSSHHPQCGQACASCETQQALRPLRESLFAGPAQGVLKFLLLLLPARILRVRPSFKRSEVMCDFFDLGFVKSFG